MEQGEDPNNINHSYYEDWNFYLYTEEEKQQALREAEENMYENKDED